MFLGHWVESLGLIWYLSWESGISEDGSVVVFCGHPSVTNEWTHSCCNNWNFPTTALLCVFMCVKMLEELLFFFPLLYLFSSLWHHIHEPQSHSHDHSLPFIILLAVCVLDAVDGCMYIHLFITHSAEISRPIWPLFGPMVSCCVMLWPICALFIHVCCLRGP